MIKREKKSFTLIETLIACAILIIVSGALLALNITISNNIFFTRQQSVAYNIAQDYLENIRQIRDTNLIDSKSETNWNSMLCDRSKSPMIRIPATSGELYSISSNVYSFCYGVSSEPRMTVIPYSESMAKINISGVDFTRKITFSKSGVDPKIENSGADVTADNSIKATVTVNWIQNGNVREIKLEELLTNWKQNL